MSARGDRNLDAMERPVDAAARSRHVEHLRTRLEGLLGIPFTNGNTVTPLRNGREIFPAMLDAIAGARSTVELLTFVYWTGEIAERMADALAEKAREGVEVRLLLDALGAYPMRKDLIERMDAAGVDIRWFRPFSTWKVWQANHRTHRKVLVVDGKAAFTGGVGIAKEWEGDARDPTEWRDTHFRVEGPAVHGLRGAFFGNWAETGRSAMQQNVAIEAQPQVGDVAVQVVRSTACVGWSDIATLLDGIIALAERRLRIATAYFSPDEYWLDIFQRAIDRGVAIEILIPGPYNDKRVSELAGSEQIGALLEMGVRLWRFLPTMLHAKILTLDGVAACVGSANFNQRSIAKDDEVAMFVLDDRLTATLDAHFEQDLERSAPTTLEDFRSRGLLRRLREAAAKPLGPNA